MPLSMPLIFTDAMPHHLLLPDAMSADAAALTTDAPRPWHRFSCRRDAAATTKCYAARVGGAIILPDDALIARACIQRCRSGCQRYAMLRGAKMPLAKSPC